MSLPVEFKAVDTGTQPLSALIFKGQSDDVVSVEGWWNEKLSPDLWIRIGQAVLVRFSFEDVGTGWVAHVAMDREDMQCPFPVHLDFKGYSPIVVVECPVGTPIEVESDESR